MKKIYIALAVFAAASLTSCVNEKSFKELSPLGENEIAFALNGVSTKSVDAPANSVKGMSIRVGDSRNGESLFLEETIENLNPGPATKGTPAYTQNVASLYDDMGVYGFGMEAAYTKMDDAMTESPQGWRYHYAYGFNPWPASDETAVDFYLNMPAEPEGVTFTGRESKTTSFSFETPAEAVDQQDMVFGYTSLSKSQHDGYLPNGAPVTLYHALTGVKFRMGNELFLKSDGTVDMSKTRTFITKVEFIGIQSEGTCEITFSDSSAPDIAWTGTATSTASSPVYQEFGDDDLVDYTGGTAFPESFYGYNQTIGDKDGLDKNLNDADASMTFWLIPQEIVDGVKIIVTVEIWDGTNRNGARTVTLDLGAAAAGTEWKAGQLRTFTIKPRVVDVKLSDKMDNPANLIKSNVKITNTGNVAEYVRANIVGNWVGKIWTGPGANDYSSTETILNGFVSDASDALMTPLWNDKDGLSQTQVTGYAPYPSGGYGTFSPALPAKASLSGEHYSPETSRHWIRIDKYYYHTTPIGPGEDLDPAAILFDTYSVGVSPEFWVADVNGTRHKAKDVHLELDILVQVILAPVKTETPLEYVPYDEAWCDYLGVDMAELGDL